MIIQVRFVRFVLGPGESRFRDSTIQWRSRRIIHEYDDFFLFFLIDFTCRCRYWKGDRVGNACQDSLVYAMETSVTYHYVQKIISPFLGISASESKTMPSFVTICKVLRSPTLGADIPSFTPPPRTPTRAPWYVSTSDVCSTRTRWSEASVSSESSSKSVNSERADDSTEDALK